MKLLREFEQRIKVDKNDELNKHQIEFALLDAMKTRRYAKFYTDKYYITVTFNRDYTIQISSNYRTDMRFNRDMKRLEEKKYTLHTTSQFIWYWMNKFRKM